MLFTPLYCSRPDLRDRFGLRRQLAIDVRELLHTREADTAALIKATDAHTALQR